MKLLDFGRVPDTKIDRSTPEDDGPERVVPFVGRCDELNQMHASFDAVLKLGCGQALLLHGESGIGKSSTLERFRYEIRERFPDAIILSGQCYEHEHVPYKGVDDVVDALSRHLSRMPNHVVAGFLTPESVRLIRAFPVLGRVDAIACQKNLTPDTDAQESRSRTFEALRDLFRKLAAYRPLLITIDDAQWKDVDSTLLLEELFREPDAPPVLLIASYRTDGTAMPAENFLSTSVHLRRMEAKEYRTLAEEIVAQRDGVSPDSLNALLKDAGGHPFFLYEVLRYFLSQEGVKNPLSATSLELTINARLNSLEPSYLRILELVSVSPTPLPDSIAAAGADLGRVEFAKCVKVLQRRRLLRTAASDDHRDRVEPYHNRIREIVAKRVDGLDRVKLHRKLAEIIETTSPDDPESLATHWKLAGEPAKAFVYFERAGDRADRALAFDRAVYFYENCLAQFRSAEGNGLDPNYVRTTRIKIGTALSNAGRGREAVDMYREAAVGAPDSVAFDLQRRIADQLLRSDYIEEGLEELARVMNNIGIKIYKRQWFVIMLVIFGRLFLKIRGLNFTSRNIEDIPEKMLSRIDACWAATPALSMIDPTQAALFQIRHLAMSLRVGEKGRVALSLILGAAFMGADRTISLSESQRRIFAARSLMADGPNYGVGISHMFSAILHVQYGNWKAAHKEFDVGREMLVEHCVNVTWEIATVNIFSAYAMYQMGDFDNLHKLVLTTINKAQKRGDTGHATRLGLFYSNAAWLIVDEPAKAREMATAGRLVQRRSEFLTDDLAYLVSVTHIGLYEGHSISIMIQIRSEWPKIVRSGFLRIQSLRHPAMEIRLYSLLACLNGRNTDSSIIREVMSMVGLLKKEALTWTDGFAALATAALALHRGSITDAVRHLSAAEALFEQADMAGYATACRWRRGEIVGGREGMDLISQSDNNLRSRSVKNPRAFMQVLAPGFGVDAAEAC